MQFSAKEAGRPSCPCRPRRDSGRRTAGWARHAGRELCALRDLPAPGQAPGGLRGRRRAVPRGHLSTNVPPWAPVHNHGSRLCLPSPFPQFPYALSLLKATKTETSPFPRLRETGEGGRGWLLVTLSIWLMRLSGLLGSPMVMARFVIRAEVRPLGHAPSPPGAGGISKS